MAILIKATGFFLSLLPYKTLEFLTECLGGLFISFPSARRRILFSNLHYALPQRSYDEIKRIAQESAARMFEMGFFSLCYPFLSRDQLRRSILYSNDAEQKIRQLRVGKKPVILLLPHLSLFETVATSPHFRPQGGRRLGAIYRPNKNKALDRWINSARLNLGMDMFSREDGFSQAREFLKKGNWLIVLFDQHSGTQGSLSLFLNRLASISTLPSLLARSAGSINVIAFPKRIGFFRTSLELKLIKKDISLIPYEAHSFLQNKMELNGGLPEWLWCHERWKTQQKYQLHLRLRYKRSNLPHALPKTTKIWIRLPNWLGDLVMTFPLIDAIRRGRPDAEITLIGKPAFKDLLEKLGVGDDFIALPYDFGREAYFRFIHCRSRFPSLTINFANSLRSDIECKILGAPRRYGLLLPGKYRPLLTHAYRPSREILANINSIHQVKLWEGMLNSFGLDEELSENPSNLEGVGRCPDLIGVLPGSANNPSKRWPVKNWRILIEQLSTKSDKIKIKILGTRDDLKLAKEICDNFDSEKVINLCGKTNLCELAIELASCSKVIGNDSGGLHLANAVGTPVTVLFGPTNPQATGPFFASSKCIVQTGREELDSNASQQGSPLDELIANFANT
jgi:heptosyltransferase-2